MEKDSKFTRDEDGYIAIRTVSAPYSSGSDDKDSMFTRDADGYVAVRTIGGAGGGGGDQHNLGYYATPAALREAYPTAEAGDWAIVGSTDTVWIWDTDNGEWVDSDQKGQVTSVNGQTGDVVLDLLPDQTGNAGKFLTTDGTDARWSDKPLVNTATGTDALTILGTSSTVTQSINIGVSSVATTNSGIAIGRSAKAGGITVAGGIAIGSSAETSGGVYYPIAIGSNSKTTGSYSISLGQRAVCTGDRSIQLGAGTNSENASLYVSVGTDQNYNPANYKLLGDGGFIPTARLTKVNSTITLTAAGWSSNTQTVNVTGMTATGVVFPCPIPADQADYTSAGIICSAQAAGTLTFTCDTVPSADIDVSVVML